MFSGCHVRTSSLILSLFLLTVVLGLPDAAAQAPLGNEQYTFKIYAVNSAFYPIIQVYLRTFDQNREPLPNINYANIGLQVKGRNYDPLLIDPQSKRPMYDIEPLGSRTREGFRTVIVLDCSLSMKGQPFVDAQNALLKYVEAKRPTDQIAVIAIRDKAEGYELVSGFQKDPTILYQLIQDVPCDGQKTRLYDSVAAAMELCATASQGGFNNTDPEYAVLNTILVLSDGKDEEGAISKEELMARIGQLPIPIPIYSLAYSNADKSSFRNLEALSKGSFGRYWTHEDSKQFGATVQRIHQINRSDYVLTFRSMVPIDGNMHAFNVAISWPAKTGRAVFDRGEFEAMESPAAFLPEAKDYWEYLKRQFPEPSPIPPARDGIQDSGASDFEGGRQSALSEKTNAEKRFSEANANANDDPNYLKGQLALQRAEEAATRQDAAAAVSEFKQAAMFFANAKPTSTPNPTPSPSPAAPAEDGNAMDFLKKNGALLGVGAGLVVLIIAVLLWVQRSGASNDPYRAVDGRDTRQRRTNGVAGTDPTRGQGEQSSTVPTDSGRNE